MKIVKSIILFGLILYCGTEASGQSYLRDEADYRQSKIRNHGIQPAKLRKEEERALQQTLLKAGDILLEKSVQKSVAKLAGHSRASHKMIEKLTKETLLQNPVMNYVREKYHRDIKKLRFICICFGSDCCNW